MAKIKISKKTASKDESADETELKPKVISAGADDDDGDDDDEDDAEEAAPVQSVSVKKVSSKDGDTAVVIMTRTIPSPRIGPHDCVDITGQTRMIKSQQYTVPVDVAEVLHDQKAAIMVGK